MTRPAFSKNYRTFSEWLKAQPRESRYAKDIIKKHNLAPDLTLNELRKVSIVSVDISQKPFYSLNSEEKTIRRAALRVLSQMRRGASFKQAFKDLGKSNSIKEDTIRAHLGNNIFKEGGKWTASKTDKIQFVSCIYTKEKGYTRLIPKNSNDRNLISKYFRAITKALANDNLDDTELKAFEGKTITDINGNVYTFETDKEVLFNSIYASDDPDEALEVYTTKDEEGE